MVTFANPGGSYTVFGEKPRDSIEGVAGLNIASGHLVSGFMEATYSRTLGSTSNGRMTEEGAGGRAGIRVKF